MNILLCADIIFAMTRIEKENIWLTHAQNPYCEILFVGFYKCLPSKKTRTMKNPNHLF